MNEDFVKVPFHVEKADGSRTFFLPECIYVRKNAYQIGKRGKDQQYVENYWDALSILMAMPRPRFRRENRFGSGKPGMVTCEPGDVEEIKRSDIEAGRGKYEISKNVVMKPGSDRFPVIPKLIAESTGPSLDISEKLAPATSVDAEKAPVISASAQARLESDTPGLQTAEREAVVKVRFGQGGFRQALFEEKGYGEKCWMSGIEGGRLLIASHIKPWSHCANDSDSRGRTDNGLLLSALWDAAFDAGLLSFDPDWNVVVSSKLSESARSALNLEAHPTLPEMFRTDGRKEYLAYHHADVFEYWTKRDGP